jgi:hypothetical protein
MNAEELVRMSLAPYAHDEIDEAINLQTPVAIGSGTITAEPSLRVHRAPGLSSEVVGAVALGCEVQLWGRYDLNTVTWWLMVAAHAAANDQPTGWVSGDYVQRRS